MKKSCISKSTKARKEILTPSDLETQVSYLLVIHLLALSQSEKSYFRKTIFLRVIRA